MHDNQKTLCLFDLYLHKAAECQMKFLPHRIKTGVPKDSELDKDQFFQLQAYHTDAELLKFSDIFLNEKLK